MKVIVLTCSTGGGHNACAKYIKEEFNDNNIECDVLDYMDLVGKKASNFIEKLYLDSTKGKGKIFGGVYKLGEVYSKMNIPSPIYGLNKLLKDKLYKYLLENNYDLAIGTHIFPCLALTALKKKHSIKFVNVATDYECIPFWEETNPDLFIIPSALLKKRFIDKGFNEKILTPTGIPVSTKFLNNTKKANLPNDKKIILITSGSMGFGELKNLVIHLLNEIVDVYVVVICGNNKKMERDLLNICNKNLIVKGFVNNMNEFINASAIVMSKPGGLTTTEIVSLRKPLIHIMPIPGVEEYNAKFFADHKMSIKGNDINTLVKEAKNLLENEKLQNELIVNQMKYINKYSAADMVKCILESEGK